MVEEKGGCFIYTYPSAAVRICQAAKEKGLDIKGVKFLVSGDPLTQAKLKEIESVGAIVFTVYASM